MNCFSCGAELDRDYIDCPNCGENLEKAYKKMKRIHVNPPGISVIIPVKDPEPYLPKLTVDIYCSLKDIDHEILFQYEVGLTNAVIEGVKRSKFSHIAVMDADGSHIPAFLCLMYLQFTWTPSLDLVVGSKLFPGGKDYSSWSRRLISRFFRSYARLLLDLKVADPMSGYVMGKRDLFLQLKPSLDYKFLLQLLCLNPSPQVVELPINFLPRRSGSSKATFKTGLRTLSLIHKLWLKR